MRIFLTNIWKKSFQTAKKAMQKCLDQFHSFTRRKNKFSNSDSKEEFGSKKQWRCGQHLRPNHEKQKISNGIWDNWIFLPSHLVSISFLLWICPTRNYQGWKLKYKEMGSDFVELRFDIIQHWMYINFHFSKFSFNLLQSLYSWSLITGI